jgi:hypothetical protein
VYYVRRRLLLPSLPRPLVCAETGRKMDVHLDHAFSCKKRGMGVTHTYIKKALHKVCEDIARYTREKVEYEPALVQWVNKDVVANQKRKTADEVKQRRGDVAMMTFASHKERSVEILDVRHCSIGHPRARGDVGKTAEFGEMEKDSYYKKHFVFPKGVQVVPFVIDAYGKWGTQAKKWIEDKCRRAASTDDVLYNRLINSARETISLAHARGVGHVIERCVEHCIHSDDYVTACQRGTGHAARGV